LFQDYGLVSSEAHEFKGWGRAVSTHPDFPSKDLEGNEITFGRKSSNTVQIKHLAISGLHCTLARDPTTGLIFLIDHSTNGTYVNNEKVGLNNRLLISNNSEIVLIRNKDIKISYIIYTEEQSRNKSIDQRGPESKYDIRETLGTGAFAVVKLCINKKSGKQFAMKIIEKKKFAMNHGSKRDNALMDEVNILKRLNHNNIISIEDVYETDEYLYLVLELVTGGDLFDKIVSLKAKTFGEARTRQIFHQMLQATNYLHEQNIVHRDLKPENILLSDSSESAIVKLSDFGLSRIVGEGSFMKTLCGTPQYLAPEVLSNEIQKRGYDKAVDLWSLGVILYILLSGMAPFSDDGRLLDQIKQGKYSFPPAQWRNVSSSAVHLVRALLTVDPAQRFTIQQTLNHPWMMGEVKIPSDYDPGTEQNRGENCTAGTKRKAAENNLMDTKSDSGIPNNTINANNSIIINSQDSNTNPKKRTAATRKKG
jgi:serine/threonine-protein kinase Chk2